MSLFGSRYTSGESDNSEEMKRRFQEIAKATPELGGFGPRDWSPEPDDASFDAPNPPLPPVSRRHKIGWILFGVALLGLIYFGIAHPSWSAWGAGICLLLLALSLALLLFAKRTKTD